MLYLKLSIFMSLLFSSVYGLSKETVEEIVKREILLFIEQKKVPGVAVALYDGDKEYLFNYGTSNLTTKALITPHTIFAIGSITKVFTTTALAVEVLNGKMQLKDPVTKYLIGFSLPDRPISQITLEELATHTSSLPHDPTNGKNVPETKEQVLAFLKGWNPAYPIGSKYAYSNLGLGVIGYALEDVEKKNYDDVIRNFILNPLGMYSTAITVPTALMPNYSQGYSRDGKPVSHYGHNAWPGGGALRSTSGDMLKFLKANLNVSGPKELLKAMQLAQQGVFRVHKDLVIGLGWQRSTINKDTLLIDKNGGVPGFSSYIGMVPSKKIGIVVLANKAKTNITEVGRKILKELSVE